MRSKNVLRSAIVLFVLAVFFLLPARAGQAPGDKPLTEEEKKELEEKIKKETPPLRYDAWCVFSSLSDMTNRPLIVPGPDDHKTTHSRPNSAGLTGFGRRGKWAHVVVDLQNTTELKKKQSFEGWASIVFNQVQASGATSDVPYAITYKQAFKIAPESENQYHFSILCPDYSWSSGVQVHFDTTHTLSGMDRTFSIVDLDQSKDELIVVVSDKPGAFQNLDPFAQKKMMMGDDDPARVGRKVASVAASELPERWQDLTIASLIIIDGPPSEGINDAQWAALKTYAQAGGRILIMAGKNPEKIKGSIEQLAGITVRGAAELPGIDQFEPPFFGPQKDNPEDPDWKLPVVEVATPNAGVVKRNSKTQIVEYSARSYGAGIVAFIPYSLTDKVLEFWHGRTTIPNGLLGKEKNLFAVDHEEEDDVAAAQQQAQQNNYRYGFFQNSIKPIDNRTLSAFRTRLDNSFENDTPVVMQSPSTVLQFLLIYLLCAVPANFLVFSVFRRREAAWLATPLLALVFTIMAYYTGYSGSTGNNTVNEVTVLEAGPGAPEAVGRTFMGVYAPQRDDYHIKFPPQKLPHGELFDTKAAPGHLVNQDLFEKRNQELPQMTVLDTGSRLEIEAIRIQQRATRKFEIQHRASVGGGIELKTTGGSGAGVTEVSVVNNTGMTLRKPIFFKNGQYAPLKANQDPGTLEPGESFDSRNTGLQWRSGRTQAFEEMARVHQSGTKHHQADRAKALTDYLEQHSRQYVNGVLYAWIDGPMLPVEIAPTGSKSFGVPHLEGITLLIVPVAASNKGSKFGAAAYVPPQVSYSDAYNPMLIASGNWKALKGKAEMGSRDEANGLFPTIFLKMNFGEDGYSRKQYQEKQTQLLLTFSKGETAEQGATAQQVLGKAGPPRLFTQRGNSAAMTELFPLNLNTSTQRGQVTYSIRLGDLFPKDAKKEYILKVVLNRPSDRNNPALEDFKVHPIKN